MKEKTFEERRDAFMKAYSDAVKEHEVDFASYPVYVPAEPGKFLTIINATVIDIKDKPVPSSVIPE